jgi:pSer/pThr/pTyr-binding forkhead associated (FHA) protein
MMLRFSFQHHAKFIFDEALGKYYVTDFGSRNGTYLNGKRLSVAKQESSPHEVVHGSMLQAGGTKLLCHIHAGRDTCGYCEPGLVQHMNVTPGNMHFV